MIIYNNDMANVKLGHNLSELLSIGSNLLFMTFVKRLTSPSTYFVFATWLTKTKTYSMEKLQPSWPDLTFVESPLKKLITKQHNNMSCVTHHLVIMQTA